MKKPILKTALPFLAAMGLGPGCDPPSELRLPVCADRQAIGFDDSGTPSCQELGSAGDPPPLLACSRDEALTIENRGGGAVRCVQRTDATGLQAAGEQAAALSDELAQAAGALAEVRSRAVATFAGLSQQLATGRVASFGLVGLPAAAASCEAEFGAGAHMCSPYELHLSASLGVIRPADVIARSWVYFPAWNRSAALTSVDRDAGLGDTCAGFINFTSYLGYRGVILEWTTLPTGATGFVFHGGDDARCYNRLPIACCR
ncbi:MAG: hypothetical protein U1A78_26925 [Polyangia bacterium]